MRLMNDSELPNLLTTGICSGQKLENSRHGLFNLSSTCTLCHCETRDTEQDTSISHVPMHFKVKIRFYN